MTAKLESIVRPFQTGDVFTAQVLPPVQPVNVAKPAITVLYGNAIQLQLKGIGITALYGGAKLKEKSRTTKTVRITNPTDPEQFVDVEKILSMKLVDEQQKEHSFQFNE